MESFLESNNQVEESIKRVEKIKLNSADFVEINGIKWATRNVGDSGTFVTNPCASLGKCNLTN